MLALGRQLGLQFQPSKIDGPSTLIKYLGILLDSIKMEAHLPDTKLAFLRELLYAWKLRHTCSLHDLNELTGYLQFCSQVIPTSHAFIRSMHDFYSTFRSPFTQRWIPKLVRIDLDWWLNTAIHWNGISLIKPDRDTIHIYMDASGSKGIGGMFAEQWFSTHTPHRLCHHHIQVKEMYAILYSVLCWGKEFRGKHVVFHIDNEAVFEALNKLSIHSPHTMRFLRHFIGLACHLDFTFTSIWLSSSENALADAASCFSYACLFQLAPYLNKQPSSKLLQIGGISDMHSSPKPLHSTSGMGLHPAHGQPTSPVKSPSSNMSSSILLQTKTVPYSLRPSKPLCNGLHPLAPAFSPKPSKLISPMSDQCILTSVYPSLPQTPPRPVPHSWNQEISWGT